MAGFEKTALRCKSRKRRTVFHRFAVGAERESGVLNAVYAKNCDFLDGALKTGVGLERFKLENGAEVGVLNPSGVRLLFLWNVRGQDGKNVKTLGLISTDGVLSVFEQNSGEWTQLRAFSTPIGVMSVRRLDGVNELVVYGSEGAYSCEGLGTLKQIYPQAVRAACVYNGRLFLATEDNKIVYSAPYQPANFTDSIDDGGAVTLPTDLGEIVDLVPFQNAVCVLYEYGLGRLETAGSAREFRFESVGYGGGRIFSGSADVCSVGGDRLFFLAEDGMYGFDGNRVKKWCENLKIKPITSNQVCNHAVFEGKYFLSFFEEGFEKKGVIVDAESGKGYEAFAPIGLCGSQGEALCVAEGFVCKIKGEGELPKTEEIVFEAKGLRFGGVGRTRFFGLRFFGNGTFEVSVGNGNATATSTLTTLDGEAYLPLRSKGKEFSLRLVLHSGAEIFRIEASTETLESARK